MYSLCWLSFSLLFLLYIVYGVVLDCFAQTVAMRWLLPTSQRRHKTSSWSFCSISISGISPLLVSVRHTSAPFTDTSLQVICLLWWARLSLDLQFIVATIVQTKRLMHQGLTKMTRFAGVGSSKMLTCCPSMIFFLYVLFVSNLFFQDSTCEFELLQLRHTSAFCQKTSRNCDLPSVPRNKPYQIFQSLKVKFVYNLILVVEMFCVGWICGFNACLALIGCCLRTDQSEKASLSSRCSLRWALYQLLRVLAQGPFLYCFILVIETYQIIRYLSWITAALILEFALLIRRAPILCLLLLYLYYLWLSDCYFF